MGVSEGFVTICVGQTRIIVIGAGQAVDGNMASGKMEPKNPTTWDQRSAAWVPNATCLQPQDPVQEGYSTLKISTNPLPKSWLLLCSSDHQQAGMEAGSVQLEKPEISIGDL